MDANAWRVEGLMADRNISRKLKGKILMWCAMPAYQSRDGGTDRETTTEAAGLQEQLGQRIVVVKSVF